MKKKLLVLSILSTLALSGCTIEIFRDWPFSEESESSTSPISQGGNESESEQTSTTSQGGASQTSASEETKIQKTHLKQTYQDYAEANAYACDYCPKTGNPKLLVVPVWFTDSGSYISSSEKTTIRNNIQTAYFGTDAQTGWRSVKTFYEEESNGALSLTGTVTDWWSCGVSSSSCDESKTEELVDEAVNWYFSSHSSERQSFDTDGNGYLDGVMLIYGAPNSSGGNDNLWAYCYWTSNDANTSAPTSNVFFWASYDFMYEDTSHCTIDAHTYIHEMGHVLGLDDYYDYSDNHYNPAGGFSMQDNNVGGHDAFSVMAYGWADPYIPTKSCTIEIGAFQTTKELILLTPSWNAQDSAFDEYLLLELYTPTGLNQFDANYQYRNGYPQGPNATGIRLWHVDARLAMVTGVTSGNEPKFSSSMTTDLNDSRASYGVITAMTNTSNDGSSDIAGYLSPLGSSYYKYDILHLIRNGTSTSLNTTSNLSSSDLFKNGSSFNMTKYKNQFATSGKLDSGKTLGWSFSVTINGSGASATASVELTKA